MTHIIIRSISSTRTSPCENRFNQVSGSSIRYARSYLHSLNVTCRSLFRFMAQSQGYKRFRSSINTINHGTSTPQAPEKKIFPRASTPNRRSIDFIDQQTLPVPSPRPKPTVHRKIHRKRRQHRLDQQYQIYVDQIIFIQQQRKSCSHCHCKKSNSARIIGVL